MQKLLISAISSVVMLGMYQAQGQGYIRLYYGTNKACVQTTPFTQGFLGGDFNIELQDGNFIYNTACNPGGIGLPIFFGPSGGCTQGATAFVAGGDTNFDGIRDDFSYWGATAVITNAAVEPYRPDLVKLNAAPSSPLPRPIGLFTDNGATVFFNLRGTIFQYDLVDYSLVRTYAPGVGNLVQMNRELVPGQYQFVFPSKGRPTQPYPVTCSLTPFVDAYLPTTTGKSGFRVTSGHWNAGKYEVDPRVINTVTWVGNSSSVVRPASDSMYFSINNAMDTLPIFPPVGRTSFPSPLATSTILPPFFFAVGTEGVAHIEFERTLGGVVVDQSTRDFRFPVRFIDTYPGFAQITFPVGTTPVSKVAASGDFDGDGWNNLIEYAYQTDPEDALSTPVGTPNFVIDDPVGPGVRTITITKRPTTGLSLKYGLQTSTGGAYKTPVLTTTSSPWRIQPGETETTMVIKSTTSIPAGTLFKPFAKAAY